MLKTLVPDIGNIHNDIKLPHLPESSSSSALEVFKFVWMLVKLFYWGRIYLTCVLKN